MKKTFTINISGIIFHIEEDAFDHFNNYLERLKRHFSNAEGSDEIIADIESRIAELLQERISDAKQVITMKDASEVIDLLGQPAEMDQEGEEPPKEKTTYTSSNKRLFRDPDNKKVAGVAAGLAAYLHIDTVWIRLLFALSLVAGGAGLLIYIVLWIVLPEAITTAEKLEMRGEPVNISNIEKSIKDEFEGVKGKFNEYANSARESFKKKAPDQPSAFEQLLKVIASLLRVALIVVGVFVGFILLITGLGMILTLLAGAIGLQGFTLIDGSEMINFSLSGLSGLFFASPSTASIAVVAISLLAIVPLALLVYLGLRLITAFRFRIQHFSLVALTVWFASLVVAVGIGISTFLDFRFAATNELENNKVLSNPGKAITISVGEQPFGSDRNVVQYSLDDDVLVTVNEKDSLIYSQPDFVIEQSTDQYIKLRVNGFARGRYLDEADQRTRDLKFDIALSDSTLQLPGAYSFSMAEKLRAQRLRIILSVPIGQKIFFNPGNQQLSHMKRKDYWQLRRYAGKEMVMTENGLEEVSAPN